MKYKETITELLSTPEPLYAWLSSHPREAPLSVRAAHVLGGTCPIARFLYAQGVQRPLVTTSSAWSSDDYVDNKYFDMYFVDLPPWAQSFVRKVDADESYDDYGDLTFGRALAHLARATLETTR